MDVIISNLVWLKQSDLDSYDVYFIKNDCTIVPRAGADWMPNKEPVVLYRKEGEYVGIPRFYYEEVFKKKSLERHPPFRFKEINKIPTGRFIKKYVPSINLYEHQKEAVDEFLSKVKDDSKIFSGGIFSAHVGAGKTICSFYIANALGGKTLVLAHTEPLLDQLRRSLLMLFPDAKIGRIQGKVCDYEGKDFVFATLQSLMNESGDKYPAEIFDYFETVIQDECLHPNTFILTPIGLKKIKDLNIGDEVVTPSGVTAKIKDKWVTRKEAFKYKLKDGTELICSENHLLANRTSKWKRYHSKHTEREIVQAKKADRLELFSVADIFINKKTNPFVELFGWYIADGCNVGNIIRFAFRKKEKLERLRNLLHECGIEFKEATNVRGDLIIKFSRDSFPYAVCEGNEGKKSIEQLIKNEDILKYPISFIRGLFDGDASFSKDRLEFNSANKNLASLILVLLKSIDIRAVQRTYKRRNKSHSDINRIVIGGKDIYRYLSLVGFFVKSKSEAISKYNLIGQNEHCYSQSVINSESVGVQDLIDIELDNEEKLFFANGVVSHNCHRVGAASFSSVIPKFSFRYTVGLSGTVRRADGCESIFHYCIGPVITKMRQDDRLIPSVWVRETGFNHMSLYDSKHKPKIVTALAASKKRSMLIAEHVFKAMERGRNPLVMSERISILQDIYSFVETMIKAKNLPYTQDFYIGGKDEDALIKASQATAVYATIQIAREGIDIKRLDTLFLTTPVSDVEQVSGRVTRVLEGKKEPLIVDYVDSNIVLCQGSFNSRMRFYRKLGCKII